MSDWSPHPAHLPIEGALPQEEASSPPSRRKKRAGPLARSKFRSHSTLLSHVDPHGFEPHLDVKASPEPALSLLNTCGAPSLHQKVKASFTVGNAKGLHTRPSTELVKCASNFRSHIALRYQKTSVNAKSLLGILTLAAGKGSRIVIEAEGEDAQEAIQALLHLAQNRFFTSF